MIWRARSASIAPGGPPIFAGALSVATFSDITAPYRFPRYNLYPAAELQGDTLPGMSSGQALAAMEKIEILFEPVLAT